jgi:hypothetical protein
VTVDVHGDAGLGVPQYLGYIDHRDAVVEHQRSCRVAQIVEKVYGSRKKRLP